MYFKLNINREKISNKFSDAKKTLKAAKKLLEILWETDKSLFVGVLITNLIPSVIPFVNAYIYKLIIDMVVSAVQTSSFNYLRLFILIGIRVLTSFIQSTAFNFQGYYDTLLWVKFPNKIYQLVLEKLSNLDLEYFENSQFKDKLERVRESYAWKPINMLSAIFYGFQSLLQFLIAVVVISQLNWLYTIPALLVAIPTFINQAMNSKISWGVWNINSPYRKKFWYLSDLIQNGLSAKEIKVFQTARVFLDELSVIYKKFVSENSWIAKKQLLAKMLLNIYGLLVYTSLEVFILMSAVAHKITVGDITYYTTVLDNFQNGIQGLFQNISNIFEQGLYVQDMFEVLEVEPKIIKKQEGIKVDVHKVPKIEFKNVSFKYPGAKNYVLKDFTLTINPGERIAFVGENGAGKTTIIKLLARFYDVNDGEILIDGINIKDLDLDDWYKVIGILFQDFIHYEYPLKENIYFGKVHEEQKIEEIIKAAKLSGAHGVAEHLDKKYEQMLGKTFEGGVELSTGQWQKVALARGFFRNAPVLILDEPTASIDAKAENEIFEKVENLSRDKTVIIISHRFSTVRNADKIYVFEKGKISEEGSHDQLMKRNGIYASLFNLQAKRYK